MIEVYMDEAQASLVGGDGLFTLGLATCIGVAVSGTYGRASANANSSDHYNKFLAHLADGPLMEQTWANLARLVQHAVVLGLSSLQVLISVPDVTTLWEDEDIAWTAAMIQQEKQIVDCFVRRAEGLARGMAGSVVRVDRHHINRPRDMKVTKEGLLVVTDA